MRPPDRILKNYAPVNLVNDIVELNKFTPDMSAFTNDALVKFSSLKSTPLILAPDKSTLGPIKNPDFILYPDPTVKSGGEAMLNVSPDEFTFRSCAFVNIVPVKSTFCMEEPFNVLAVRFKLGPIMNDNFALFVMKMYPDGSALDASYDIFSDVEFWILAPLMSTFLKLTFVKSAPCRFV